MICRVWLFLILIIAVGCAIFPGLPEEYGIGYRERGLASWYGEPFHGRATASGEIFNMHAMTAAHRTLPLGTYLKVTNLDNGKVVTVKVNDRGPFIRGRILDLSFRAAQDLEMIRSGTAPIELHIIEVGPQKRGSFTVQVGSFMVKENAQDLLIKLKRSYREVFIEKQRVSRMTYYKVQVGEFPDERSAKKMARKLDRWKGLKVFVTRRES